MNMLGEVIMKRRFMPAVRACGAHRPHARKINQSACFGISQRNTAALPAGPANFKQFIKK
jgi:hypothetical protein